jgi:hypothetical protein
MNTELKNEISNQISHVGDSEIALAVSRAGSTDVNAIAEEIRKHRAQYENGRVANIGAATFASAEQWQALAAESDRAARAILMQGSAELTELDRLEKAATDAKRLADAKSCELSSAWREFSHIPERADAVKLELDGIAKLFAELEPGKIEADFKAAYTSMLNGAAADVFGQTALAGLLITRELRKECLNEKAAELNKELAELKARSKALAKKLGQKATL